MLRFILTLFIGLCLLSGQGVAKDDGGFGSARFSAQAPAALGGDVSSQTIAKTEKVFSPADIEPAAGDDMGDEENLGVENNKTDLHESKHQSEPIIIKKDMSVR